jgi:hypothetical protein
MALPMDAPAHRVCADLGAEHKRRKARRTATTLISGIALVAALVAVAVVLRANAKVRVRNLPDFLAEVSSVGWNNVTRWSFLFMGWRCSLGDEMHLAHLKGSRQSVLA